MINILELREQAGYLNHLTYNDKPFSLLSEKEVRMLFLETKENLLHLMDIMHSSDNVPESLILKYSNLKTKYMHLINYCNKRLIPT